MHERVSERERMINEKTNLEKRDSGKIGGIRGERGGEMQQRTWCACARVCVRGEREMNTTSISEGEGMIMAITIVTAITIMMMMMMIK